MGRLTKRREFVYVAGGAKHAAPGVVVQARRPPHDGGEARAGFTATKKIGGAVVRNRAKRRLRHAAGLLLPRYGEAGVDYVFIARAGTLDRAWERLLDDVKSALIRLRSGACDSSAARSGGRPSPRD
ncbi:MAG: ribonuclease P protein component [Caulobacterales bacterium]|nr:ribonuclease P protein component [Caulobacterales bacterium]